MTMRVPFFHSAQRGIGLVDAWHDNDECPIGKSIKPHDREPGQGEFERCQYCALLGEVTPAAQWPVLASLKGKSTAKPQTDGAKEESWA